MDAIALLIAATLNAGTVLALAGLGLLINERAGIVTDGLEHEGVDAEQLLEIGEADELRGIGRDEALVGEREHEAEQERQHQEGEEQQHGGRGHEPAGKILPVEGSGFAAGCHLWLRRSAPADGGSTRRVGRSYLKP